MRPVLIHEVGLRDGLQSERQIVPTALKADWLGRLIEAGLDLVQVGSFVNPAKVPPMADTDELFRRFRDRPRGRTRLSALVLNEKGLERALDCGVDLVCAGASASETHSQRNTGVGTAEAVARVLAIADAARKAGLEVQASVQSAFGCGFEGPVGETRVMGMVAAYVQAGLRHVSLADTAGHGHPAQVAAYVRRILALCPEAEVTVHLHDTYGLGMANAYAAMEAGAAALETSFGGLGGCPFTKVAAGNLATEDLVHGLQQAGQRLDLRLDRIIGVAQEAAMALGRELPGRVYRTGGIRAVPALV
ncbi:MAG: hydroxymethylglutaryl-CoA lyase [Holophagaceae bacterium]